MKEFFLHFTVVALSISFAADANAVYACTYFAMSIAHTLFALGRIKVSLDALVAYFAHLIFVATTLTCHSVAHRRQ